MQQILIGLVASLGTALLQLLTSLVTAAFLKKAIILGLEKLVNKTESDLDNKLLEAAKEAWGVPSTDKEDK